MFFALNQLAFAAAAAAGLPIAFSFFVWVSIFGVVVIAQLWAFAADSFNLKSGQRLFPVIMVGANLGALAGAKAAQLAAGVLSPVALMVAATGTLLATLALAGPERRAVPEGSMPLGVAHAPAPPSLMGGIGLVMRDRYLLLIALLVVLLNWIMIALLVVLLNWINSTGEFILADFVQRDAVARVEASGGVLDRGAACWTAAP